MRTWKVGDTFTTPTEEVDYDARFPNRRMVVVNVIEIGGLRWLDAAPETWHYRDEFSHAMFVLDDDGEVLHGFQAFHYLDSRGWYDLPLALNRVKEASDMA